MNYPKVLYQYKEWAGDKFMPSNGTEGMIFIEAFCDNCIHEKWTHTQKDEDKQCEILSNSMIEDKVDEWVISDEGWPICTQWSKWDWGNDDDSNEPPELPPFDPNQLDMFPLHPSPCDLIKEKVKQKILI